jgi:ribose-phosphate pyrophosphokinase
MQNMEYKKHFITLEEFQKVKKRDLSGPNGWLLFVACNSGIDFALSVKNKYEESLQENRSELKTIPIMGTHEKPITTTFSDTETCPRLQGHVAGSNAYVFQCIQENVSGNTVNENIQQMIQVVRTLRAHGAETITVITPYSPYSRQDKPTFMKREAALAALFADQLKISGADIYLTYHPHTLSLYGFYEPDIKFVALSGLDLFASIFKHFKGKENVIAVSTDAGGAKFNVYFSNAMDIPYAIANKYRFGKDKSNLLGIIGDLENKNIAIITDDETVTGSSIFYTIESLYTNYNIKESYAAVSHMKLKREYIPRFIEVHEKYGLKELHITDTIPQIPELEDLDFVVKHSLAGMFAATINRLHYNQSVTKVFSRS